MSLKNSVQRAYRLFRRAVIDSRPRITLSKNLYFRLFPDKAVLVSLGMEIITIDLSLNDLSAILKSIHLASSSRQIHKIRAGSLNVETDGRPQDRPLFFSETALFDWLWSSDALASSSKPSTDPVWIHIAHWMERIHVAIERRNIERAYGELAKLHPRIQT